MDRDGLDGLSRIIRSRRNNAAIGWVLVGLVVVTSIGSFLRGDLLWALFTATVVLIAALPAINLRSVWVMPPWEVILMAALPTLGHLFATTLMGGRLASYLSVAALALLVAVDLDAFTQVEMNDSFAVLFVVVATLATAGVWAVVRWLAAFALGTQFTQSEHALMLEFVASSLAGAIAGLAYVFYFRRRTNPQLRTPEEVELP